MKIKLINPILMWFIIVIGGIILYFILPNKLIISLGSFRWFILTVGVIYWIYILSKGTHQQTFWSVDKINHLITGGAYKLARHPSYGAYIFVFWGLGLFFGTLRSIGISIWAILIYYIWARLEEWGLAKKFGKEYTEYKKRTPMFYPWA